VADIPRYTLSNPVAWGDDTVTELVFKSRPKVKHLKAALRSEDKVDTGLLLLSACVGRPAELLDELDAVDGIKAMEMMEDFLGHDFLKTGQN
jgi:hypothetical protein